MIYNIGPWRKKCQNDLKKNIILSDWKIRRGKVTVWPDDGLKKYPNFLSSCQKSDHFSFYLKSDDFKISPKVTKQHLGYIWKKICHQELSKIARSDHTESRLTKKAYLGRQYRNHVLTNIPTKSLKNKKGI